jgi:hypothetical protein
MFVTERGVQGEMEFAVAHNWLLRLFLEGFQEGSK